MIKGREAAGNRPRGIRRKGVLMNIFDRMDPSKIDQRDAQLWILAIAMIVIFSGGLALLALQLLAHSLSAALGGCQALL